MSTHPLDRSLPEVTAALRAGQVSAVELVDEAVSRHLRAGDRLHAYMQFDAEGARDMARRADDILARDGDGAPALCGVPVAVKDLYGVTGLSTFAGTPRRLPPTWEEDGWLVARLRHQSAVFMGKTHTVELAYGALGINPNWDTPRNPWDAETHRIPGGSSSGAGVSLHEGSALVALGTDTGGSIRIPASMTGVVGHKTSKGRWPTTGVVPLSTTLDTVGALTRSATDAAWFFGAVDPDHGDPAALLGALSREPGTLRIVRPRCAIVDGCQDDVAEVVTEALEALARAGCALLDGDGALLDDAATLYLTGGIAGAECAAFLRQELPEWSDILHPIVGTRVASAARTSPDAYQAALAERRRLAGLTPTLFGDGDVLALPTVLETPAPLEALADLADYGRANARALQPTAPASILGLCAVTVPVGRDGAGMPVGLQLVAPGGDDELALAAALVVERVLGTPAELLGPAPRVAASR